MAALSRHEHVSRDNERHKTRDTRFSPFPSRLRRSNVTNIKTGYGLLVNINVLLTDYSLSRMRTAEHLPSGWPFESSHYKSTFRTPQLGYCRHNVYPSSVHRKNNPHAALIDPYQYPDKVTSLYMVYLLYQ